MFPTYVDDEDGKWKLPTPEECEYEEDRWRRILSGQEGVDKVKGIKSTKLTDKAKAVLRAYITVSPFDLLYMYS